MISLLSQPGRLARRGAGAADGQSFHMLVVTNSTIPAIANHKQRINDKSDNDNASQRTSKTMTRRPIMVPSHIVRTLNDSNAGSG